MKNKYKIIFILVILGLAYVNHFVIQGETLPLPSDSAQVPAKEETSSKGKALIGGDFTLVDQNGEEFSSEKLKGKKSIIYFGFSHCPMICPTALSSMTLVMNEIDPKAERFTPVFITTDPNRDTPERLKEYLQSFHPTTIGLTGSKEALEKAYAGYKVYAKKVDNGTENYDMNHSSIIYIMDEDGEYIAHFNHESPVEDIAVKLNSL